ncbi:MAG TPA: SprB repeat-containing protein, partial [Chitinophagaceae bacterium]|nr:SprB repeat-containing protein [Chitinophagaceae bacterium]
MNQNSNSRFMHIFILKIACFLILFSIQTFAQQTVNHSTVQPGAGLSDSYVNTQYFLQIQPEANDGFITNENAVDDDFNCGNCSGFKTYTQGGWGAKASGNNPGMYLKNNFAGAFPSGVTIGSSLGYTIKFTSYQSIDDFLPSGSSSVSLTKNYTNPGSSYKNVLAGQLLAATLNVKFDYYDPNFGNNSIHLGDLIIASGTFSGWTVNNLLVLANNALGGSSSGYSLSDINNALDQINNNYDNGTANNNFLNCPAICTLTLTGAKTDALCNGASNGSITLTATGGSGTVRYLWNDGYTSQNRTGLAAGTYSVTATDNANCTATFSATISQPAALSVTGTATNATTNKGSNGSIQLTASGGTFPYTYSWNDGNNSKDRSGLKAGNYTVSVTDAKGCTASKQFVITEPSCNVSIASQVTNVSCFGGNNGSINLTITGSNGGTTFLWNNGTTTEDRSSLAAGNYSVTVTDNANCTAAYSTAITQPTALTLTGIATNVSVFHGNNGGIQLTTSGGTAPYTYTWNDGSHAKDRTALQAGNFSVTVTDAKGCTTSKQFAIAEPLCNLGVTSQLTNVSCFGGNNGSIVLNVIGANGSTSFLWNNGSTAKDRSGVPAGTYSVTVTDDANCVALHSATITQPSALSITGTAGNVTTVHGSNGSIQIAVTGGTSPYTYSWNDGSTAKDRSALQAGTFTVTATDAKGCTVSKQFTIDEPVCNLTVTSQVNNASCFGAQDGIINLSVTGANGNSTFLWNNGSAIKDRTGLAAGTYSVTVTDNANCIAIYSTAVSQPLPLVITGTTSDVTLVNGNNGSIQIVPSGGTAPYTYLWNDGSVIKNRTALHAGNYSVTVTDAHGCSTAKQFTIAEPVCNLSALSFTNNVSCSGAQDGSIHLTVSGANGTPQFIWSNGAVTENNNGLSAGAYSVTVTDEANCTATYSMNIIQPSALSITGTAANVTTVHGKDGNKQLTMSGDTAPYTYAWNDGSTAK